MPREDLITLLLLPFIERRNGCAPKVTRILDLWARDIVRLLRERAPEVARRAYKEDGRG